MKIIAVDPGLTIGLAFWDSEDEYFQIQQTNSPVTAMMTVEMWQGQYDPDVILVENYISGGHLTSEAKETLKIVGLFEYWIKFKRGIPIVAVAPQKRLSAVGQATILIGAHDLSQLHRNGKDAVAALAHAIAYSRGRR